MAEVTNAQFQAFIDDGGYRENAPWWEGLSGGRERFWPHVPSSHSGAVYVACTEAMAEVVAECR